MNFNGRFQNKKETIDIRCPECQVVSEYQYDETIEDDVLTCPECDNEFFYKDIDEEDEVNALPDVDLSIQESAPVIQDTHAFILEHCESNEHLKEILTELYVIGFVNGTKQQMVTSVQKTLEEIQSHNETFSALKE